ncbi:sulfite exporter TauE/SafE family protein [Spongiivirga sp. MCCC 1A20706]|uniref:sulfite exporter TauE/SafE family protein n=1 Tax=Spongiivirga sp. MCCC 1A20706 TaxID=3160963 RepID=UPI00397750BB
MIYTAFILGLLGSFHCVGMCGPIAFLLPLDRKNKTKRFFEIVSYHTGRIGTYALLGLLFGWLGSRLELFGFQQRLSIIIGLLMITLMLIPKRFLGRYQFSKPIYTVVSKLKSTMGAQLKKKDPGTFFTLGFLNGLLPCGLVYLAIFGAIGSGKIVEGSLYMAVFGLGTIPLMTTAIYLGNFLKQQVKRRILQWIPMFVVIIGLLFVLRGLGLGIPYISPSNTVAVEQVSSQQSCH